MDNPESGERELTLHPDRQGLRMVLGDLEAGVMDVIWGRQESAVGPERSERGSDVGEWCTVRDVYETLRQDRRIAYTTVMNTMTRLANKGILESSKQGLVYLYRPRQSKESFIDGVVGHVLSRLLVQFTGPTQAALRDFKADHPQERTKMERLLREVTQKRKAGETGETSSQYTTRDTEAQD